MQITFLGAAGTVTGSSYVLTSDSGQSVLIDLGMFQGTPEIEQLNYLPYAYDVSTLSGMILTHAHLDHCGRLPILLPKGFRGDIWMTQPTKELTEIALLDAAKIARTDEKEVLYDEELVLRSLERFKTASYHQQFSIGDFDVTFFDAGHILGSATVEIIDRAATSQLQRIVFSGDIGNYPEPLQRHSEFLHAADAVVMESTYGDRLHPQENPEDAIRREINEVEKSGGTLLIPAFSLERTQELLHFIKHLKADRKVSAATTVYMDGPMAQKATDIYLSHPEILNDHIQAEMTSGNPFDFPGLEIIKSAQESRAIHEIDGPKVIIAGSGMMVGGRIVGHAGYYLEKPSTRLLIVGFQGEGTLGRELLEGAKEVVINGVPVTVAATITSTRAMSSHADQDQLLTWLKSIHNVKHLCLTHGEDGPRAALAELVQQEVGITQVTLPKLNQTVTL